MQPKLGFCSGQWIEKLGVEKSLFVTRAIVLDMMACYGTPMVKEGTAFNRKEIDEQAKRQGLEIKNGDVVLFHTGWQALAGAGRQGQQTVSCGRAWSGQGRRALRGFVRSGGNRCRHLGSKSHSL
ncbi:MAG: cyclase family protein [Polaromonas sp.]|nr:cyclase family protein [Polaromonas sp.]MDI1271903.1 cyclase family protein [Polaromonas sp.]